MELIKSLGIEWKVLLAQIVNFFILLVILYKFLYRPLLSVLEKRKKKIKESLENAEKVNRKMKKIDKEIGEKLAKSKREAAKIIEEAKKQGRKERKRIKDEAKEQAEILNKKVQKEMEQEKASLIGETRKEMGELIVTLAEKFIKKGLAPEDKQKINKELVKAVKNKQQ